MYFNSLKLLFNHKHINCKPQIFFIVDFTPHLCLIINACFWHSRVSIHQVPQPLPPKVSFFLQETQSTYFLSKRYTSKSINLLKHFVIFKLLLNWQKKKKCHVDCKVKDLTSNDTSYNGTVGKRKFAFVLLSLFNIIYFYFYINIWK